MKIVNEPPKTGEQFIVNWFDDGVAKSVAFRFHEGDDVFYYWSHTYEGWIYLSPIKESTYFDDKVIIVE